MAKKKKKLARPAKGNYIKVQAKFHVSLVDAIEKLKGEESMNAFLNAAAHDRLTEYESLK